MSHVPECAQVSASVCAAFDMPLMIWMEAAGSVLHIAICQSRSLCNIRYIMESYGHVGTRDVWKIVCIVIVYKYICWPAGNKGCVYAAVIACHMKKRLQQKWRCLNYVVQCTWGWMLLWSAWICIIAISFFLILNFRIMFSSITLSLTLLFFHIWNHVSLHLTGSHAMLFFLLLVVP